MTSAGFQVSLIRSQDGKTWQGDESLDVYLSDLKFHSEPLAMAKIVGSVSDKFPDLYGMVFISDGEETTWEGFNWKALAGDFSVRWAQVGNLETQKNFYIGGIGSTGSYKREQVWQLNIGRNESGSKQEIRLSARTKIGEIWSGAVTFYKGQSTILEQASLP